MKESKKYCDLKGCFFCTSCQPEWLHAIAVRRKTLLFDKGETLCKEGEKVNGIFFVNKGTVKVHKKWGEEKELIVRFAKAGDIVGHRGLGENNIYPISATALDQVTACFIDIDFFLSSLKVNQDFLYNLMLFFADELQESEKKMSNLVHMPVKGRIVQALLSLHNKFGTDEYGNLNLHLSRQDIASYAGTVYETYFRIINELSEEGLIKAEGKKIKLLNRKGLMEIIS